MTNHGKALFLTAVLASLAGCASTQASGAGEAGPHHAAHWGYASTVGPELWKTLHGNEQCGGAEQSPIALAAESAHRVPQLPFPELSYRDTPVKMLNNGHSVEFEYEEGSTARLGTETYRLKQFHFHVSSEHMLEGHHLPSEVHLVHVDGSGAPKLVVGILIQEGAHNAALDVAFKDLPEHKGDLKQPPGAMINAKELLPANTDTFFSYGGSLTTPPCTQGIKWFVMASPIEMDEEQLRAYAALPHLNPTNRPVQPIHERRVLMRAPEK